MAQTCNPGDFSSAYGFQLYGTAAISGEPKPVATIGRLEFGSDQSISGVASTNFGGLYLGNPVTGSYEIRGDCTINWTLQDDSGNLQHFAGNLQRDLQRGTFRQTDPGAPQDGILVKVAPNCSAGALQRSYHFSISGTAGAAQKVSLSGVMEADASGALRMVQDGARLPAGTATVDSDCIVEMELTLPAPMKLRGVLVDGGAEILAIDTVAGTAVKAVWRAE
jgi:hypothetical protein